MLAGCRRPGCIFNCEFSRLVVAFVCISFSLPGPSKTRALFFSTEKSCRHFPKTIREWEEHAPTCAGRLTFPLRLRKTLLPGYTRIYVTSRKLNSVEREQEKGKKKEGDPAYIYKIQGQRYGHKSRKHAVGWLRHSYFMTSIKNRLLVFFSLLLLFSKIV